MTRSSRKDFASALDWKLAPLDKTLSKGRTKVLSSSSTVPPLCPPIFPPNGRDRRQPATGRPSPLVDDCDHTFFLPPYSLHDPFPFPHRTANINDQFPPVPDTRYFSLFVLTYLTSLLFGSQYLPRGCPKHTLPTLLDDALDSDGLADILGADNSLTAFLEARQAKTTGLLREQLLNTQSSQLTFLKKLEKMEKAQSLLVQHALDGDPSKEVGKLARDLAHKSFSLGSGSGRKVRL